METTKSPQHSSQKAAGTQQLMSYFPSNFKMPQNIVNWTSKESLKKEFLKIPKFLFAEKWSLNFCILKELHFCVEEFLCVSGPCSSILTYKNNYGNIFKSLYSTCLSNHLQKSREPSTNLAHVGNGYRNLTINCPALQINQEQWQNFKQTQNYKHSFRKHQPEF